MCLRFCTLSPLIPGPSPERYYAVVLVDKRWKHLPQIAKPWAVSGAVAPEDADEAGSSGVEVVFTVRLGAVRLLAVHAAEPFNDGVFYFEAISQFKVEPACVFHFAAVLFHSYLFASLFTCVALNTRNLPPPSLPLFCPSLVLLSRSPRPLSLLARVFTSLLFQVAGDYTLEFSACVRGRGPLLPVVCAVKVTATDPPVPPLRAALEGLQVSGEGGRNPRTVQL